VTFQRKPYTKPLRAMPVRSSIPLTTPVVTRFVPNGMRECEPQRRVEPKTPNRVQQSIRDSARGEACTVRIPGVCTQDPEKTIWSHAPFGIAGKGKGLKALDICGSYACTACDAVLDGQVPRPPGMTRDQVLIEWMFGHLRSLVILRQKGLV
jgi:hypothetical protein